MRGEEEAEGEGRERGDEEAEGEGRETVKGGEGRGGSRAGGEGEGRGGSRRGGEGDGEGRGGRGEGEGRGGEGERRGDQSFTYITKYDAYTAHTYVHSILSKIVTGCKFHELLESRLFVFLLQSRKPG